MPAPMRMAAGRGGVCAVDQEGGWEKKGRAHMVEAEDTVRVLGAAAGREEGAKAATTEPARGAWTVVGKPLSMTAPT